MTRISRVSWLWRPAVAGIGWGDIALATALSAFGVVIACRPSPSQPHGSALAAIGMLAITGPVAWQRRAPLGAAIAIAIGTAGNALLIGPLVRCGPSLPAILVIAFFAGTRLSRPMLATATACCLAAMTVEAWSDPVLGLSFLEVGIPAVLGACAAGRLAHSRSLAASALRARNAELRAQRERTAELAVAADRARVAADLHDFVHERITAIADVASTGRDLITADPAAATQALAQVETSGRATLAQMREVVGNLRAERLTGPQPVLADLGSLLERATTADARLTVTGSPRELPAGLELSAYRIVEHLLDALEDAPDARVDVRLRFGPDALELDVAGPPSSRPGASFATARERVALLGGTLRVQTQPARCTASVSLPLAPAYASP